MTSQSTDIVSVPQNSGGSMLSVFGSGDNFELAQRMAKALSTSSLVPKDYQGNLGNSLIALELSSRVNASPLMVMQNLDVIHGRPSWRSQFIIAAINTCGRFSPLRFRFEGTEGQDDWGCRACAIEKASGEELKGPLVTIKISKDEGWYSRNGSKWKTMPELMLRYRSAAFFGRLYASELLMGIQTKEEVIDLGPDEYQVVDGDADPFAPIEREFPEGSNGSTEGEEADHDPETGEVIEDDIKDAKKAKSTKANKKAKADDEGGDEGQADQDEEQTGDDDPAQDNDPFAVGE